MQKSKRATFEKIASNTKIRSSFSNLLDMDQGIQFNEKGQRTLLYFRIIHAKEDLGEMSEAIYRYLRAYQSQESLRRKEDLIDKLWSTIERFIDDLPPINQNLRVYQDGLPVCGREIEIVKDLAAKGSRNHQLVVRLMEKGATVMGTESAELLLQEYEMIKRIFEDKSAHNTSIREIVQKSQSETLVKKRDQFIACRINHTLQKGETGFLFLGMLHSLEDFLEKDIRVIDPLSFFHE